MGYYKGLFYPPTLRCKILLVYVDWLPLNNYIIGSYRDGAIMNRSDIPGRELAYKIWHRLASSPGNKRITAQHTGRIRGYEIIAEHHKALMDSVQKRSNHISGHNYQPLWERKCIHILLCIAADFLPSCRRPSAIPRAGVLMHVTRLIYCQIALMRLFHGKWHRPSRLRNRKICSGTLAGFDCYSSSACPPLPLPFYSLSRSERSCIFPKHSTKK